MALFTVIKLMDMLSDGALRLELKQTVKKVTSSLEVCVFALCSVSLSHCDR